MKNLINRLISKKANPMTNPSNPVNVVEEPVRTTVIDPKLFSEPVTPVANEPQTPLTDPVKDLLNRNHHGLGYNEGFDFHDVAMAKNYKDRLVEEFRDIMKKELRKLDNEEVRLKSLLSQREELSVFLTQEIEQQIAVVKLKHTHILDEFEAAEFERGQVKTALLDYERGFQQGFKDFLTSSQFVSSITNA
jgi:hypothetical protein